MTDIEPMTTEEQMRADGIPTEESAQQSYFGLDETHRWMLPDGISWIEHKTLNEGARRKYQDGVNREVAFNRVTGDAHMRLQTAEEQHKLIQAAVVDWNLLGPDKNPLPFSKNNIETKLLKDFPPKIIDSLLVDIRKHNPWLMQDMTSEDIRKQIAELEEMLEIKLKEEEGNEL